jgi:hypothetical protein
LFINIAQPMRMSDVWRICGTYHHPMPETCGTETARRAVAPPGGWLRAGATAQSQFACRRSAESGEG